MIVNNIGDFGFMLHFLLNYVKTDYSRLFKIEEEFYDIFEKIVTLRPINI